MKPKVYIDGKEGTTGLQIYDRLTPRTDIELLLIDDEKRKDPAERKKLLNAADLVFLCLPDEEFDQPLGLSTGAGVIFGATGGSSTPPPPTGRLPAGTTASLSCPPVTGRPS